MLKRYGVKYSGQSKEIKEKWANTIEKRLGVRHNMSIMELHIDIFQISKPTTDLLK